MRKFIVCGVVVAISAMVGSLMVGSPSSDGLAHAQPDHGTLGERVVSLWQSDQRRVNATVALHVKSTEGRPTHYRSSVEVRCLVRDADSLWRGHPCTANFGQRLVRDQTTVIEGWSELTSDDSGVIQSVGPWEPVTCRALYTAELVAYQIGVAGEVHTTAKGSGLHPSYGDWAVC